MVCHNGCMQRGTKIPSELSARLTALVESDSETAENIDMIETADNGPTTDELNTFDGSVEGVLGGSATDATLDRRSRHAFGCWFTWCQQCRHGGHAAHLAECM